MHFKKNALKNHLDAQLDHPPPGIRLAGMGVEAVLGRLILILPTYHGLFMLMSQL